MSWITRNWLWLASGAVLGLVAFSAASAKAAGAPTLPIPPPPSPPQSATITLAEGVMPAVTVAAGFGGTLTIQVPGTAGGSITGLSATSGYLLGDNVPGPETKATGTPPNSGTAGSNNTLFGWNFVAAGRGTSGTITVVWFDSTSTPHQTQIPITLV